MGEYRFSVYLKPQIGLKIAYDGQIVLSIPFLDIRLAISKNAKGFYIGN